MFQIPVEADASDLDTSATASVELQFLDDASYEFVGGGDGFNGY